MILLMVEMILIFLINKVILNKIENNIKEIISDDIDYNQPVEEEVKTDEFPPQRGKPI